MTAPDAGAVPAPGSDAARKAGCTCPLAETFIPWRDDYVYQYEIDSDCPVHGLGRLDLTLRPRVTEPIARVGVEFTQKQLELIKEIERQRRLRPRTDAETGGTHVD